jgi:hypothetical protein
MLLCPELMPVGGRVTNSKLTPLGGRGYTELTPAGSVALSPELAPLGSIACSKLTPIGSRGYPKLTPIGSVVLSSKLAPRGGRIIGASLGY